MATNNHTSSSALLQGIVLRSERLNVISSCLQGAVEDGYTGLAIHWLAELSDLIGEVSGESKQLTKALKEEDEWK